MNLYPPTPVARIALLALAFSATSHAQPPPPPVGFLWVDRGLTLNADNGTFGLPELTGFNMVDTSAVGPGSTGAAIDLGKSSISVPGAVGSGSSAGDLYYEMASNSISIDFAISGSSTAVGFGFPDPPEFAVTGSLNGDFGAGSFAVGSFNHPFTGTANVPIGLTPTVTGVGLTDGSPISLDLAGELEIIRTDGGTGLGFGLGDADLTFNGSVTLDQSYRTFELVVSTGAPIPEASSSLLLLLGTACLWRRRRA